MNHTLLVLISIWWHKKRTGHTVLGPRRVSVPSWDPGARGLLSTCLECEEVWGS